MTLHLRSWWLNVMVLMTWKTFKGLFQDTRKVSLANSSKNKTCEFVPPRILYLGNIHGCVNTCHLRNIVQNKIISCLLWNCLIVNISAITAHYSIIDKPAVATSKVSGSAAKVKHVPLFQTVNPSRSKLQYLCVNFSMTSNSARRLDLAWECACVTLIDRASKKAIKQRRYVKKLNDLRDVNNWWKAGNILSLPSKREHI